MWQPILAGNSAIVARSAISAIAADLACPPANSGQKWGPTLAGGDAGIALFFAYLGEGQYDHVLTTSLENASAAVEANPLRAGLYGGFSGVAWVVQHLIDLFPAFENSSEDPNESIDLAVLSHLRALRPPVDYDLINGIVGLGLYSLERLPRESAAQCLHEVIRQLAKAAEHRPDGITWWTPPSRVGITRLPVPNGYYNLGVAHGVPGVIGVLGEAWAADVTVRDEAMPLLDGAVQWVLAQRSDSQEGPLFPYHIPSGEGQLRPSADTRLAWCYGDLGIATTLLAAARAVGRIDWEREAVDVALNAAKRPITGGGVIDPSLCHGSGGVAHLFNRMYQATGDPVLRDAALSWYGHTLSLRKPSEWIGGFYSWDAPRKGEPLQQVAERGFLTGAAGVGLCLLAAVEAMDPAWDRLLLARIPPGRDA